MAQHARYRHTRIQVAVSWLAHLVAAVTRPAPGQHALIGWPTVDPDSGATEEFGDDLHALNGMLGVRDEVRA